MKRTIGVEDTSPDKSGITVVQLAELVEKVAEWPEDAKVYAWSYGSWVGKPPLKKLVIEVEES